MTKQYKKRIYFFGKAVDGMPEYRAYRQPDGSFVFEYGTRAPRVRIEPTPAEWAALALAISIREDDREEADATMLAQLQDEQDPKKALADALMHLAEGCDARQCDQCKRWVTDDLNQIELRTGDFALCDDCVGDLDPPCRCRRPDCGDCGRLVPHLPL